MKFWRAQSILLVEDQEQVRELAVTVLRHAGYSVDNAPDGAAALMLVEKLDGPLRLPLTDVVMPLISGPELVSQIRHRSPSTRVLNISGYAKPFTRAQLLYKVRKALDE